MSDALSGLAQGGMKWLSDSQANKNARAQNATTDKWGPMLALFTHGGGAPQVKVPHASFAEDMGPAIQNAMNGLQSGGGGGGGGSPMMMAGDQGEGMGGMGDLMGMGGGMSMMAAGGGQVPRYAGGGQQGQSNPMGDMISMGMKMLPMLMMALNKGGQVPGKARVPGDSPANDTKLIAASPGEVMLPRTIAQEGMKGNHWKVAQYLSDVKKHGPGPMPIKKHDQPKPGKAPSSSMSPWQAMAAGGKVGC